MLEYYLDAIKRHETLIEIYSDRDIERTKDIQKSLDELNVIVLDLISTDTSIEL